jgi:hypothetical protein
MIGARGWHSITATQPSYNVDAIITSISLMEAELEELKKGFSEIEEFVLKCVKGSKRT